MAGRPASPKQMQALEGRWTGRGEIFSNPFGPAGTTQGAWSFRMDAPGLHLVHDYREQRSDGNIFDGHGVFAIDPDTSEFLWYWFDTYGHPPLSPARGRWAANILRLEKHTPRGVGRSSFRLDDQFLIYEADTKPNGANEFIAITRAVFERVQG